mmetsp:Transcript_106121/g.242961  ORF Transcript_106121/g.242961 Transcript_106121/m.242961 type:complete len:109 (+) Transcript_106121:133-459(+)
MGRRRLLLLVWFSLVGRVIGTGTGRGMEAVTFSSGAVLPRRDRREEGQLRCLRAGELATRARVPPLGSWDWPKDLPPRGDEGGVQCSLLPRYWWLDIGRRRWLLLVWL